MTSGLSTPAILEEIAGLTVQGLANGLQRGKSDTPHAAVFQQGQVGHGETNPFRQFGQAHLALGHDHIEIHDNGH